MNKNPVIKIKIGKHVCAVDKKERYFTTMQRAGVIDDNTLIQYASNDSGMRIEQIAAVYKSLVTQVRELVCNGHSVQLGDLGTLYFKVHAKISADLEGAGGAAVTQKWIGFRASKAMRQQLDQVNFQVN
jgi:nucleoid DNA-binding protein